MEVKVSMTELGGRQAHMHADEMEESFVCHDVDSIPSPIIYDRQSVDLVLHEHLDSLV